MSRSSDLYDGSKARLDPEPPPRGHDASDVEHSTAPLPDSRYLVRTRLTPAMLGLLEDSDVLGEPAGPGELEERADAQVPVPPQGSMRQEAEVLSPAGHLLKVRRDDGFAQWSEVGTRKADAIRAAAQLDERDIEALRIVACFERVPLQVLGRILCHSPQTTKAMVTRLRRLRMLVKVPYDSSMLRRATMAADSGPGDYLVALDYCGAHLLEYLAEQEAGRTVDPENVEQLSRMVAAAIRHWDPRRCALATPKEAHTIGKSLGYSYLAAACRSTWEGADSGAGTPFACSIAVEAEVDAAVPLAPTAILRPELRPNLPKDLLRPDLHVMLQYVLRPEHDQPGDRMAARVPVYRTTPLNQYDPSWYEVWRRTLAPMPPYWCHLHPAEQAAVSKGAMHRKHLLVEYEVGTNGREDLVKKAKSYNRLLQRTELRVPLYGPDCPVVLLVCRHDTGMQAVMDTWGSEYKHKEPGAVLLTSIETLRRAEAAEGRRGLLGPVWLDLFAPGGVRRVPFAAAFGIHIPQSVRRAESKPAPAAGPRATSPGAPAGVSPKPVAPKSPVPVPAPIPPAPSTTAPGRAPQASMARQGTAGSRTASADPTGPPSSSEQTPRPQVRAHEVHPHVRRLPDGQKPSPQRVELARECGIELEHNETLVTGHLRGNKPHEGASAGAEGPEHVLPTSMGERMTDEDAIRQLLEHDVPPEQAPAFLRAPYRRIWEAHQRRKQLEREEAERLEQVLRRMERMDPYSYYNEEINRHPLKRLKHTLLG